MIKTAREQIEDRRRAEAARNRAIGSCMNGTDRMIIRAVCTAYLAAVEQMESWKPESVQANAVEAHRIIGVIREHLSGTESFHALVVAFTGLLVALAEEPEAVASTIGRMARETEDGT